MNPLPVSLAMLRRNRVSALLFLLIIALATALGVAISAQERALRLGSARAADGFDLIVAAPGSQTDLLFSVVYLRPTATELLSPGVTARLLAEPRADFVAPIGFGDEIDGAPVVGTIAALVDHLSGGLAEGRMFAGIDEAVIGAQVPLPVGGHAEVRHGLGGGDADAAADAIEGGGADHEDHADDGAENAAAHEDHGDHDLHPELLVVGRMNPTGTPWDRAVIVPVEYVWSVHALGTGHLPGETHIGPPFAADMVPGLPALVVKPADVGAAYGLRGAYRDAQSTAFFPAEVLVQLYSVLGDAAALMGGLTLAALGLVVAAIFVGLVAVLDLQRQSFALLRALGASRLFVVLTVWTYASLLIVTGAVLGLLIGWGMAAGVSSLLSRHLDIALHARIGGAELRMVAAITLLGVLGAALPALALYRRAVVQALR